MAELQDHAIAAMFPLLDADELQELAESIQKNGQREDIVLYQGEILDGRNRYRACQIAGTQPQTRNFDPKRDGTSVLQFVLDHNLKRRHLSAGIRATIMAKTMALLQKEAQASSAAAPPPAPTEKPKQTGNTEPDGTIMESETDLPAEQPVKLTDEQAAAGADVSRRTMQTAKKLESENPEAAQEVIDGKKSLNKAAQEQEQKKQAEERKKIISRIRKVCGENFAQAFIDNEILKTAKELAAFVALDDETMEKVGHLVATGWKVARATAHVTREITGATTIDDLINRAIAEKDELIHNHNGWEIAVTKIDA